MSFKEDLKKEQNELMNVKRPYESVAFILLAILVIQQLVYLVMSFWKFAFDSTVGFFSTNGICTANLMNWIARIFQLGNTKWSFVIAGIVGYFLYYALIYFFVWRYCQKHGLAKWTWSLFVAFGPTIFLAPAYIWFVIYAFWPYITRFMKRAYVEFKEFDPHHQFKEEEEEPIVEEPLEVVSE